MRISNICRCDLCVSRCSTFLSTALKYEALNKTENKGKRI
ncbi:hypothetical protein T11_18374 [Trichinella zimbabwensis]|uniref:Uncharacterized protein n=1 Tax=Trichinella zimbabwensis TaxID=268475 RepID=A0A0V1GF54_9BILA|nr:hypothetical protein T11_18374 [Trichinella zimbabwensis]